MEDFCDSDSMTAIYRPEAHEQARRDVDSAISQLMKAKTEKIIQKNLNYITEPGQKYLINLLQEFKEAAVGKELKLKAIEAISNRLGVANCRTRVEISLTCKTKGQLTESITELKLSMMNEVSDRVENEHEVPIILMR
ncbi:MAG: hypothetical protein DHS20C02_03970 [Micavibrio sp.]|nr:MAG: hypothetical protein DHS20C02_03970 [Micavibrio sp.]